MIASIGPYRDTWKNCNTLTCPDIPPLPPPAPRKVLSTALIRVFTKTLNHFTLFKNRQKRNVSLWKFQFQKLAKKWLTRTRTGSGFFLVIFENHLNWLGTTFNLLPLNSQQWQVYKWCFKRSSNGPWRSRRVDWLFRSESISANVTDLFSLSCVNAKRQMSNIRLWLVIFFNNKPRRSFEKVKN